jgi:hypothetical protein
VDPPHRLVVYVLSPKCRPSPCRQGAPLMFLQLLCRTFFPMGLLRISMTRYPHCRERISPERTQVQTDSNLQTGQFLCTALPFISSTHTQLLFPHHYRNTSTLKVHSKFLFAHPNRRLTTAYYGHRFTTVSCVSDVRATHTQRVIRRPWRSVVYAQASVAFPRPFTTPPS